jgi:ArsR family transcriptional regulator, arsenate/arsenite/antimonite-responsive transcriptional repressor
VWPWHSVSRERRGPCHCRARVEKTACALSNVSFVGIFVERANIERISQALANETRLLIFEAMASNKEISASAIVTLGGVSPATVSHHLKILSEAGLIQCRRRGQFVHNRVLPEAIETYARALYRLSRNRRW